jgi:hypothetical protein
MGYYSNTTGKGGQLKLCSPNLFKMPDLGGTHNSVEAQPLRKFGASSRHGAFEVRGREGGTALQWQILNVILILAWFRGTPDEEQVLNQPPQGTPASQPKDARHVALHRQVIPQVSKNCATVTIDQDIPVLFNLL